jgi:hypothetical protein
MPPVAPAVAAQPQQIESPKPVPTKVIEVIDLARAYEPVREPEEPAGTVNPASLIQVPDGPRRIPAAIDLDDPYADVVRTVQESVGGPFFLGAGIISECVVTPCERSEARVERVTVMPREVLDLSSYSFFHGEIPRSIPSGAAITPAIPVEAIKVMPREVKVGACREERERSTAVREDDFVGRVDQ